MERRSRLALSGVEPEIESARARQIQEPGARTGDDQQTGELRGEYQAGCGPPVSLHSSHDGNHGREKDLQAGQVSPEHERRGGLGSAGGASGLQCFPASGLSSRATGERADGTEDPGDDSLLRRRFANKGNACYMNATVQSLQWLLHISGQGMDQMGAGGHFFQTLRDAGNYVDLMQVQQWREIVAGWAEVHRQHDIGEFMGYMLTRMRPPIIQGRWQARCLADDGRTARCLDQGHGTQALLLGIPSRPPGLAPRLRIQDMLNAWHHDRDRTVGFVEPPLVLPIQLLRFQVCQGSVRKTRTEVHLEDNIQVPVFNDDGLDTQLYTYSLQAYVVHHGLSPKSGHYTTVLMRGPEYWLCDAERSAVLFPEPPPHHHRDCYILLYHRSQSHASTHHDS